MMSNMGGLYFSRYYTGACAHWIANALLMHIMVILFHKLQKKVQGMCSQSYVGYLLSSHSNSGTRYLTVCETARYKSYIILYKLYYKSYIIRVIMDRFTFHLQSSRLLTKWPTTVSTFEAQTFQSSTLGWLLASLPELEIVVNLGCQLYKLGLKFNNLSNTLYFT